MKLLRNSDLDAEGNPQSFNDGDFLTVCGSCGSNLLLEPRDPDIERDNENNAYVTCPNCDNRLLLVFSS